MITNESTLQIPPRYSLLDERSLGPLAASEEVPCIVECHVDREIGVWPGDGDDADVPGHVANELGG